MAGVTRLESVRSVPLGSTDLQKPSDTSHKQEVKEEKARCTHFRLLPWNGPSKNQLRRAHAVPNIDRGSKPGSSAQDSGKAALAAA